jgi:superfamily II DNA helicase RecQ
LQKLNAKNIPCFLLSTVNETRISDSDIEDIANGRYRAVFMSPEIIFGQGTTAAKVGRLWADKHWRENLISIVVDEIHCVKTWADFRQYYQSIGTLRGKAPGVPIVGLTATLPSESFEEVKNRVFLSSSTVNVIRVDDVRNNIKLEVHTFSAHNRVRLLARLLDKSKTIVYFDSITLLRDVQDMLRPLRTDLRIDAYFSTRVSSAKDDVMLKFINNEVDVLLATDACGMGCDIPDIITVFQYE